MSKPSEEAVAKTTPEGYVGRVRGFHLNGIPQTDGSAYKHSNMNMNAETNSKTNKWSELGRRGMRGDFGVESSNQTVINFIVV